MNRLPPEEALCLHCNYPLCNLTTPRCPECGSGFDPADWRTMNLGRAIGTWGRRLIRPVGCPTLVLALAGMVLIAWVSPLRGWARPGLAEAELARAIAPHPLGQRAWVGELTRQDKAYLVGCGLFALACVGWISRVGLRWVTLAVRRPGRALRKGAWGRQAVILLVLGMGAAMILFGWPGRMAWHYATKWKPLAPYAVRMSRPGAAARMQKIRPEVLRFGLMHMPPAQRADYLRLVVEEYPALAGGLLGEAIGREEEATLKCDELHVLALLRQSALGALYESFFADGSAEVRAAAIDALGVLHAPAYPVEMSQEELIPAGQGQPIELGPLLARLMSRNAMEFDATPQDLPAGRRKRIEQFMLEGATAQEREAAARALINWPPEGYELRYAEWGVWLCDRGQIKLAQRMLDANPPFVHQAFNPAKELERQLPQSVFISNKPVIHLTADRPLSADVEIKMHRGRPWSVYPRPDDLVVESEAHDVSARMLGMSDMRFGIPLLGSIAALEKAGPALGDLGQGYPWLGSSRHRRAGGMAVNTVFQITGMGVRWQSLIVSPKALRWMKLPEAPAEAKFDWWKLVREVPASYVASRGETERFLFYDGPTVAQFPIDFVLQKDGLECARNAMNRQDAIVPPVQDRFAEVRGKDLPYHAYHQRAGIYLEVGPARTSGYRVALPDRISDPIQLPFGQLQKLEDEAVFKAFWDLLGEKGAGLTTQESGALVQTWKKEFFFTPGKRLLLVMSAADYDAFCPLEIRPRPTKMARVGVVVWEFK